MSRSLSLPGSLFWTAAAIALVGSTSSGAAANAPLPQLSEALNAAKTVAQDGTPSTTYGGIEFGHLSFEDAISRAERTGKILVILWVGDELKKEEALGKRIFGDEAVQRWMEENATGVRIDAKQRKKDAKKAGVQADQVPLIDLLDVARGGRIDRIPSRADATQFLASVFGIGDPQRPTAETANEPFSWLAWANAKFRDGVDPDAGKFAVEGYSWCLTRAEAVRPGFRAKYLEFLLQRVAQCKQRSPDAIRVLEKEYTTLARRINNNGATRIDVYEVTRVAFWLRKEQRVMDLFKNLRGGDEKKNLSRRWLFATVAPILGRYEEYDEMLDVIGDKPLEMFQARIDLLKGVTDAGPEPQPQTEDGDTVAAAPALEDYGTSQVPFAIQDARGDIIDDASWCYEALLSDGRGKDARDLMILITTTFPVNKAFGLFVERAQRLELWGPSAEVADLGMAVLDEKGQRRMQRLLGRIPKELPKRNADKNGSKDGEKDGQ